MEMNSYQWTSRGKTMKAMGVFEVDAVTALVAQVESLSEKIDCMMAPLLVHLRGNRSK